MTFHRFPAQGLMLKVKKKINKTSRGPDWTNQLLLNGHEATTYLKADTLCQPFFREAGFVYTMVSRL